MSIIHDALKKVQETLDRSYGRRNRQTTPPEENASSSQFGLPQSAPVRSDQHHDSQTNTKILFIFGYAILFCVGVILILALKLVEPNKFADSKTPPLVENRRAQQVEKIASNQTPAPAPTPPKTLQRALPTPVKTQAKTPAAHKPNELILNGTMLMDNQRVALINDDVYVMGDTVDDKQIVEITLKEVKLKAKDGSMSTLKALKRR